MKKCFSMLLAALAVTAFISSCSKEEKDDKVSVKSIELSQTTAEIYPAEELSLTATTLPDDATDKSLTWSTSDPAVATVENGKVTAVAGGTATITVASVSDPAVKASCTVSVKDYTKLILNGTKWTITDYSQTGSFMWIHGGDGDIEKMLKNGEKVTLVFADGTCYIDEDSQINSEYTWNASKQVLNIGWDHPYDNSGKPVFSTTKDNVVMLWDSNVNGSSPVLMKAYIKKLDLKFSK